MQTIVDAIVDGTSADGTLTVLPTGTGTPATLSWAGLHERAARMATVLARQGIGQGSRVGLLGDTGLDLIAALQAVWLTGAAVTVLPPTAPLSGRSNPGHLATVVAHADLNLVVADNLVAGTVVPTRTLALAGLAAMARHAPASPPRRPDPADLALLQFTSGSTSTPRGVPVTHAHLAANIDAIRKATNHEAMHPGRTLSWLPLYHDMGLIGFLTLPMCCGCPLVLQSPAAFARRPAAWLEAIARHRITMSGAPNFAYALMTRLLLAGHTADLSSVRFLLTGGEPVDAAIMERFVAAAGRCGLDPAAIVPAYGLAESTLAVTFSPPGTGIRIDEVDPDALESAGRALPTTSGNARRLVRLGHPVPGTALRIVDATGTEVGPRTLGRVEIRGRSVVGHYWPDPPPPEGHWLGTGDLGYLTDLGPAGELVLCGREKDVLHACGRNVFPQDVEVAVAQVPGVRPGGAAAFGVPGGTGDRLVVAVESHHARSDSLRRNVTAAVLDEVGMTPTAVVVLPHGALPKTSSGKLRRAEARRRYLSGRLSPTDEQPTVPPPSPDLASLPVVSHATHRA